MEEFVLLNWDSDFFNFPVGKIESDDINVINDIISLKKMKLYYVFTNLKIDEKFLLKKNGLLVDEKVILRKVINKKNNNKLNISFYKENKPDEHLYKLALVAGKYSRFKLDKRLPNNTYERLYNIWINKSCNNDDIIIFIYKQNNSIIGFLTLKIHKNKGVIELIAVDEKKQGLGIGKELIFSAENYLLTKKINNIEVATQFKNKKALSFYKKLGYREDIKVNIYHFINN